MKKQITLALLLMMCSFISKGQNIQFAFGTSVSQLDWQFKYDSGELDDFYVGSIIGLAADINFEYLEKEWFSVSSDLGYFQSGGEISSDEVHPNWVINETKNNASNFSLGTSFNFIPLNKKMQLMIGVGPRIDYLIPIKNSAMSAQQDLRKFHFGLTGSLGYYYKFDKVKIGLKSNYLHRVTKLLDTEPTNSNNWWEPQKLGVKAKDQWIMSNWIVIGFQL